MMLDASSRVWCLTTSTSGLISLMAISAESTFGIPIRSFECATWRCRSDMSTPSLSTRPSGPTPAAAGETAGGEPRARGGGGGGGGAEAAGTEQQHLRVKKLELTLDADLGDQRVARVALA